MLGYFFTADLLGFGAIIRNSSAEQRGERVGNWLALVDSAAESAGIERLQLISDTVFAAASDTQEGLMQLLQFARQLLNIGVPRSLPIRGAIVRGDYEWGRLTYGQAVVDAHSLEQLQDWIGVTCANRLPHVAALWGPEALVVYPVPFKRGQIRYHAAVAWEVPQAVPLLSFLGREGLAQHGEELSWEVAAKANNTVQFGTYLRLAARRGGPWDKYTGLLPMDLIERAALGPDQDIPDRAP